MKTTHWHRSLLAVVLLVGVGTANAQTQSNDQLDDQADVWAKVEQQWTAVERGDNKWIDKLLTEDFSGWGNGSPAPQNKTSTKMWTRFNEKISQMVAHELYPLSIVVHGDVAVAHYLYTSANEQKKKDGGIKTVNGRYTDILVRTDEGWKFLAWSGGEDD